MSTVNRWLLGVSLASWNQVVMIIDVEWNRLYTFKPFTFESIKISPPPHTQTGDLGWISDKKQIDMIKALVGA